MTLVARSRVYGPALSVRGNDIDTDQILPARFMKSLTFDELGEQVFFDSRQSAKLKGQLHPFDDPARQSSKLLLTDVNFGCGSSREHAPQALHRWGIEALIGLSFAEIFAGNCISVGMPCVTVTPDVLAALREAAERDENWQFTLDLEARTVTSGNSVFAVTIAEGPRRQFIGVGWDPVALLLAGRSDIEKIRNDLPYMQWNGTLVG